MSEAADLRERPAWARPIPNRAASVVLVLLVGLGSLIVASWFITVVAHLDDGYGIDHVAGTWIALARYANDGILYPPFYDGEAFGGTRFMPMPTLIQAAAAQLSGEYLVSAKALSAVLALGLAGGTFMLLRRRCPFPVAFVLSSTLLLTGTGLVAATSIRNDVLPVGLQLAAITIVASSTARGAIAVAGLLCAVALLGKLSAIWGPAAIVVYLLRGNRRALPVFGTALLGTVVCGVVVFQLWSNGRFAENVVELSTTGSDRYGSFGDLVDRLRLIVREGLGPLVVLPLLGALGTLVAVRRRDVGIYHLAFIAAVLMTSVVLVDPGAYVNHLLDVQVLSLLVIGELWRYVAPASSRSLSWASLALACILVGASAATYRETVSVRRDLGVLVHGTADRDRLPRLTGAIAEGERVLSEDPFVQVSRGVRPVVLDPYMLIALLERHPEWRRDLVDRIGNAEFDKVVLYYVPNEAPQWYERVHLGSEIVRAIEARYRRAGRRDGYWLYVPR